MVAGGNELDFFSYLQKQTEQKYGAFGNDYEPLPSSELEEKKAPMLTNNNVISQPVTSESLSTDSVRTTSAVADDTVQKLSEWKPMGSTPPEYKPSASCANCSHYSCEYCRIHDFPCRGSYVCADYVPYKDAEYQRAYRDGYCFSVDLAELSDSELEVLAKGWATKQNLSTDSEVKKISVVKDEFPIFNTLTANCALELRHQVKDRESKRLLLAAASRYEPQRVQECIEEDKANETQIVSLSSSYEEERRPSNEILFSLAYASDEADVENLSTVYDLYEVLYEKRYGSKDGMYLLVSDTTETPFTKDKKNKKFPDKSKDKEKVESDDSKEKSDEESEDSSEESEDPNEESEDKENNFKKKRKVEKLSEGAAGVTASASVGTEVSIQGLSAKNMLYQVAENRVKSKAKRDNREYTDADVQEEYKKISAKRGVGFGK